MKQTRNSVADIWGERTPYYGDQWPERIDEKLLEEPDHWVQSCCVLCTNGCGLDIGVKDGRIVGVRGRADDRVSRGRLGPKGMNAWQANQSPDRLTRPLIREGIKPDAPFREASWNEVLDLMVRRCRETCEKYTSGAVGFYNSGQLFIEDYYTLSVMAHAGLGTKHVDGNTRLCTATASFALRESFGNDGNPASVTDYDTADCIAHFGHNIANTQTVAWARILDRRRGPNPPKLIVVDPRRTDTAREADVHLAPRLGTNVAVMNGLLNLVIANGDFDGEFVEQHTVGFEKLKAVADNYPPERVEGITGIPALQLREAAKLLGGAQRLLCTVLQGFYQANEATCSFPSTTATSTTATRGVTAPRAALRAANELTITAWDVVSKQPNFKYAAANLTKVGQASLASRVLGAASHAADRASELADNLAGGVHPAPRNHLSDYLSLLSDGHEELIAACEYLESQHEQNAEIREGSEIIADFSRQAVEQLRPFVAKYGKRSEKEPRKLRQLLFAKRRAGGFGLLRDLHGLHVLAAEANVAVKVLKDAALELRDGEFYEACALIFGQSQRQQAWIDTMLKESAADSLVVPS